MIFVTSLTPAWFSQIGRIAIPVADTRVENPKPAPSRPGWSVEVQLANGGSWRAIAYASGAWQRTRERMGEEWRPTIRQ